MSRRRRARATASSLLWTSSLWRMFWTWLRTVVTLMNRRVAISCVPAPSACAEDLDLAPGQRLLPVTAFTAAESSPATRRGARPRCSTAISSAEPAGTGWSRCRMVCWEGRGPGTTTTETATRTTCPEARRRSSRTAGSPLCAGSCAPARSCRRKIGCRKDRDRRGSRDTAGRAPRPRRSRTAAPPPCSRSRRGPPRPCRRPGRPCPRRCPEGLKPWCDGPGLVASEARPGPRCGAPSGRRRPQPLCRRRDGRPPRTVGWPPPGHAQRVEDHEQARGGHQGGGDHRLEQARPPPCRRRPRCSRTPRQGSTRIVRAERARSISQGNTSRSPPAVTISALVRASSLPEPRAIPTRHRRERGRR